ncbi:hypothetical protein SYNPS1DRAFT_28185 [Syncephalis pseudoplumigaleata]|uniref:Uncharacterized protein n=1 Tax=Syncephalis pseudoplumigaleata TaxID=1712513 RepID=A0A4P9Z3K9_9FUNG|nr:hypothetical protein SYNPS1DRAFT_28185 [Syncephalis pseudoplumigaleata]|eukprot:RKP26110.1 hypothetical protein SYNPS1DRAFT_28185 [Syncephalis pseudoplumigaleata]
MPVSIGFHPRSMASAYAWLSRPVHLLIIAGLLACASDATPIAGGGGSNNSLSMAIGQRGKGLLPDGLTRIKFQRPNIHGAELLKLSADTGLCLSLPTVFHRNVVFTTCSTRGRDDDLRSLWNIIPLDSVMASTTAKAAASSSSSSPSSSPYVKVRNLQNGLCLTFHAADRHVMTDECAYSPEGEPIHTQLFRFHQPADKANGASKLISAESDDTDDNRYDCLRSGRSYHDDIATLNNISFLNALIETCDHNQRWQYIQRQPVHSIPSASDAD